MSANSAACGCFVRKRRWVPSADGSGADKEAWGADQQTPLHTAVHAGSADVCRVLVEAGADTEAREQDQQTPLHLVADRYYLGHADVCRVLVEAGADKEARDSNQQTPLHLAAREGKADVCRVLVEAGADKEARDASQHTPLHMAVLRMGGCQMSPNDIAYGNTYVCQALTALLRKVFLKSAPVPGRADVCRVLVEAGADKEARDSNQQTALRLAVNEGEADVVLDVCRMLIEAGADKEARDGNQQTPLHAAVSAGRLDMCRVLLEA
jgi:ankyrin repeat protein